VGREVELKLEVPASAIDDVARLPWLSEVSSGMPKCQKLVSVYFDTAKSELREHGLVLRVRHTGENRLQTIKAVEKGARGAFERDEWEEEIESDMPNLKLANGTALEPLATKKLRQKLKPGAPADRVLHRRGREGRRAIVRFAEVLEISGPA
jgi:inorganic triphosphatase YgiF